MDAWWTKSAMLQPDVLAYTIWRDLWAMASCMMTLTSMSCISAWVTKCLSCIQQTIKCEVMSALIDGRNSSVGSGDLVSAMSYLLPLPDIHVVYVLWPALLINLMLPHHHDFAASGVQHHSTQLARFSHSLIQVSQGALVIV